MPFGEIVCGSPGSGKSTYCFGKYQLFTALNRPISIVNLDPANDALPYPCAIDISSLITLGDVMDKHGLGPNGGLLYCMEYLEVNFDWLEGRLKELGDDAYVLFDLPGQVELSTNHESIKRIVKKLTKNAFRVCLNIFSLSHFSELYLCLSFSINNWAPPSWLLSICVMRIMLQMLPNMSPSSFYPFVPCCNLNYRISMSCRRLI
jgi:GTPase SAR1 family protein